MCTSESKNCSKVPKNTGLYMRFSKQSAFIAILVANLANAQSFTEITTSIIPNNFASTKQFWIGSGDFNADGCNDLFNGQHADNGESPLYVQEINAAGRCSGVLTYVPKSLSNHSQALPANLLIGMRYVFGNYFGSQGPWSYYGYSADVATRSKYIADGAPGAIPHFAQKVLGCSGARAYCLPTAIMGGSTIAWAKHGDLFGPTVISNINTNALVSTPPAKTQSNFIVSMDVDTIGVNPRPELINILAGGYWRYDGSTWSWCDCLPAALTGYLSPSIISPIDYDADGDMDIFYLRIVSNTVNGAGDPHLLRNDSGVFSDVAGLPAMATTSYWSGYGNITVADLKNDGYPDIIYCASGFKSFAVYPNSAGVIGAAVLVPTTFGTKPYCSASDLTNDGLLDIATTGPAGKVTRVYSNNTAGAGDWLRFHLRGLGNNGDGVDARIMVTDTDTGAVVSSATVTAGYLIPHIGVGGRALVDVTVTFPDDLFPTTYYDVPTSAAYLLYEQDHSLVLYTPGNVIPRQPL